jgi:hypothetical protein
MYLGGTFYGAKNQHGQRTSLFCKASLIMQDTIPQLTHCWAQTNPSSRPYTSFCPDQGRETGFYSISHFPVQEPQKRQPLLSISHHAVHIYSTLLTAMQHIIIPWNSKPLTSKTHGNVMSKEHSSLMPRLVISHPQLGYSRRTSTQVLILVTSHRTINLHLRIENLLFH